jgi:hypothetical protein
MSRRGRPRSNSVRIQITMRLHPERDADLIQFFRGIPIGERVRVLKRVLRGRASLDAMLGQVEQDVQQAQEAAENILGAWNF